MKNRFVVNTNVFTCIIPGDCVRYGVVVQALNTDGRCRRMFSKNLKNIPRKI